jgi:hypothetical protein
LEFLLQPPTTVISQSFGCSVSAFSQALSIQLQPMLSTAFHPAVASTASSSFACRCNSSCSYLVKGPSCIWVFFRGLWCNFGCLILYNAVVKNKLTLGFTHIH